MIVVIFNPAYISILRTKTRKPLVRVYSQNSTLPILVSLLEHSEAL
jgi:hypothetical protein